MTTLAHSLLGSLWLIVTVFMTRGIFLFLAVYYITRALPKIAPEFRHALWFAVICGIVLLPSFRFSFPAFTIEGLRAHALGSPYSLLAPLAFRENIESVLAGSGPGLRMRIGPSGSDTLSLALAAAYLCGVTWFLIRPFAARFKLRAIAAAASKPGELGRTALKLSRQLGILRPVALLVHHKAAVPFTYGWFRPRIILPSSAWTWSLPRARAVLLHELAHIKRGDCLLNSISYAVCAFLWFMPFVWIALSSMRKAAELSCDLRVVDEGLQRTEYASTILELAVTRPKGAILGTQGLLGGRSSLEDRLRMILRPLSAFSPWKRAALSACLVLFLLAMTFSLQDTEKIFGTWVNTGTGGPAQYAWSPGGMGQQFARYSESGDAGVGQRWGNWALSLPCSTGSYVIDREWMDAGGNTWFNMRTVWSSLEAPRYALARVDASGTICEVDESLAGYPSDFSGAVGFGMHQIYVRD